MNEEPAWLRSDAARSRNTEQDRDARDDGEDRAAARPCPASRRRRPGPSRPASRRCSDRAPSCTFSEQPGTPASPSSGEDREAGIAGEGGRRPRRRRAARGRHAQRMEATFGPDFSDVRVHTGGSPAASARAVDAHAYTVGNEIVLGEGQTPGSPSHERTLAHELTHVVQQRSGPVDGTPAGGGISLSDPADRFERAAEATADAVVLVRSRARRRGRRCRRRGLGPAPGGGPRRRAPDAGDPAPGSPAEEEAEEQSAEEERGERSRCSPSSESAARRRRSTSCCEPARSLRPAPEVRQPMSPQPRPRSRSRRAASAAAICDLDAGAIARGPGRSATCASTPWRARDAGEPRRLAAVGAEGRRGERAAMRRLRRPPAGACAGTRPSRACLAPAPSGPLRPTPARRGASGPTHRHAGGVDTPAGAERADPARHREPAEDRDPPRGRGRSAPALPPPTSSFTKVGPPSQGRATPSPGRSARLRRPSALARRRARP